MSGEENGGVGAEPAADGPDWVAFTVPDPDGYNSRVLGPMVVRRESETTARVRMIPGTHTRNIMGNLHGGALLGFVDVSLFAALQAITARPPEAAVTVDLSTQFIAAGRIGQPLYTVVELLRETGRLAFMRGMVEQDGDLIGSFQGTVRKLGIPR